MMSLIIALYPSRKIPLEEKNREGTQLVAIGIRKTHERKSTD